MTDWMAMAGAVSALVILKRIYISSEDEDKKTRTVLLYGHILVSMVQTT